MGNTTTDPQTGGESLAVEPRLLTSAGEVAEILPQLLAASVVGLDCETTGLDPHRGRLRLVQLAAPGGPVYCVDCSAVDPRVLQPLFAAPETPVLVGHNLAFDLAFLSTAGLVLPPQRWLVDTGLAGQLLEATPAMPSLAALAERHLGVALDKAHQQADWGGALSPALLDYAARDAAVLVPLYDRLTAALKQQGLERAAALEFRALPFVVWLRLSGVPWDPAAWEAAVETAEAELAAATAALTSLLPQDGLFGPMADPDSPQAMRQALSALVGQDLPDTADGTLALLDHPAAAALRRYRRVATLAQRYTRDWATVHPTTGRVHPDWRQLGTATGRMACTAPNVQQLPRDGGYRRAVAAQDGRVLVKLDYAQIELRVAAELSGEERLLEAFARGEDVHRRTAQLVLGVADPTPADRQRAKALNFGLLFGMSVEGFQRTAAADYGLRLTLREAGELVEAFFRAYPGLRRWQAERHNAGVSAVRTASGRVRWAVRRPTERMNTPVQGTAADGLKAALGLLWRHRERLGTAVPVLVCHDEVVFECAAEEAAAVAEAAQALMVEGMQRYLRRVPVEVEATVCQNWSGDGR
ncbi:DNA polymerase [Thermomicrobiaceae bacterium CFH 74404]|uniref:DNA polymerase I n=1 Tax=Thermalbibacter longus TaxID=2951981 RepID=A0AA42BC10_9BACT|nr:DNA polymerase [Thermalbibacter longus]MCM8750404.1 DNA polymerase [Thermalbibacter longus]